MPDKLLSPSMGLMNSDLQKANADPSNVKAGLTFYAGDKTLKTGTLQDLGSEPSAVGGGVYNNGVYFHIGEYNGWGRYIVQRGVRWDFASVANLIGLTADKIRSGQQILGIWGNYSGDQPNITAINQSGGWGEGTILSSWGCWAGSTGNIRMAFHWRAESDYNVNGYIRFMKDGNEVAAQAFEKGSGFVDKSFNSPGNYNVQIRVDYHAGNGTFYIGGMFVGY